MRSTSEADRLRMGERLRQVRGKRTIAQLAAACNVSQSFWSRLENGRSTPSLSIVRTICDVEGICQDWLMTGDGPMKDGSHVEPVETGNNHDHLNVPDDELACLLTTIQESTKEEWFASAVVGLAGHAPSMGEEMALLKLLNLLHKERWANVRQGSTAKMDDVSAGSAFHFWFQLMQCMLADEQLKPLIDKMASRLGVPREELFIGIMRIKGAKKLRDESSKLKSAFDKFVTGDRHNPTKPD